MKMVKAKWPEYLLSLDKTQRFLNRVLKEGSDWGVDGKDCMGEPEDGILRLYGSLNKCERANLETAILRNLPNAIQGKDDFLTGRYLVLIQHLRPKKAFNELWDIHETSLYPILKEKEIRLRYGSLEERFSYAMIANGKEGDERLKLLSDDLIKNEETKLAGFEALLIYDVNLATKELPQMLLGQDERTTRRFLLSLISELRARSGLSVGKSKRDNAIWNNGITALGDALREILEKDEKMENYGREFVKSFAKEVIGWEGWAYDVENFKRIAGVKDNITIIGEYTEGNKTRIKKEIVIS